MQALLYHVHLCLIVAVRKVMLEIDCDSQFAVFSRLVYTVNLSMRMGCFQSSRQDMLFTFNVSA